MALDDPNVLAKELGRLRSIVSDSTEFITCWRPDGTCTYINEAYCRYFGGTQEEIVGKSLLDRLDPKAGQKMVHAASKLTPESPVRIAEFEAEQDDEVVWIEWTDRGVFDHHGELVEIHSVGRDVTDRHNATEALSDSEAKYRKLVEEASDTVLVTSKSGELLHINPAGIALFGFNSHEEALGTDVRTLCVDPNCYEESVQELVEHGVLEDREVTLLNRDGRELTVLQSATVIRDADGEIHQIRAILHDITRRRQLEEHVYHGQRLEAVGKLAGGIAHDFNNLLTVIGGNAELLVADFPPGSPHRATIEAIREASEKAVALTRQLLAYGRRQVLMPERLNINKVVEETTSMLRRVVEEDIEILNSLAPNLGSVWADPEQIKQVLVNLALNGRDAMPRGGCLDISTQNVGAIVNNDQVIEEGSYVRLTVSSRSSLPSTCTGALGLDWRRCTASFARAKARSSPGIERTEGQPSMCTCRESKHRSRASLRMTTSTIRWEPTRRYFWSRTILRSETPSAGPWRNVATGFSRHLPQPPLWRSTVTRRRRSHSFSRTS
jgi:PAS domain S-box-containing protein